MRRPLKATAVPAPFSFPFSVEFPIKAAGHCTLRLFPVLIRI